MDKKLAKIIQDHALEVLQTVAKNAGLTVRQHGGTIKETSVILKFEFSITDPEIVAAAERTEFARYCGLYGLRPDDYGREFVANRQRYRLVGFNLNSPKYEINTVDLDTGKVMRFTKTVVANIIAQRDKAEATTAA